MNRSEQINELAAALAKAQGMMSGAKKDSQNPFYKSYYADLASITDAIQKPLAANGLSYTQQIVTNDKDECGVEMLLMHSSGQWIHYEPFFMPVTKQDAQGFGSCATYSARYQLRAVFGVSIVDDDANAAVAAKPNNATQVNRDAFDLLDATTKDWIVDHAKTIVHLHETNGDMLGYIEMQEFDTESKLALWSQLPAATRSAVKRAQNEAAEAKRIAALMKGKAQTEAV